MQTFALERRRIRAAPTTNERSRSVKGRHVGMMGIALALLWLLPADGRGQTPEPADVASIDGIIAAVYGAISGPAGQPRDWDRFRSLMAPGARLIPTGPGPNGQIGHRVWTVEEYIEAAGPGLEQGGFFERELGRAMDRYGPVVHLMSAYDSRRTAEDPEPFARGVNSFQLLNDGTRWWVMSIFWASETPDNPIPDRFLSGQEPPL